MNPYEQYIMPRLTPENRGKTLLYIVGGAGLILLVWWFVQVVIGRNFKLLKDTFSDPANGGQVGGQTWNAGGQVGVLSSGLEDIVDRLLEAKNNISFGYWCGKQEECRKTYWNFLGVSEGLSGQIAIAKRYQQKYGRNFKKDYESLVYKVCLSSSYDIEIANRMKAVLNSLP